MSGFKNALFGEVVKAVDGLGGARQQEIADMAGISQTQVSLIKRGVIEMLSTDKLLAIAEALGIGVEFQFKQIAKVPLVMENRGAGSKLPRGRGPAKGGVNIPDFSAMED